MAMADVACSSEQAGTGRRRFSPLLTIEQVASRTGLTKRTLRYYEELGLLRPTGRSDGNYRLYSEDDVERVERIKELRDLLGFSLAEIRAFLEADDEREQLREAFRQESDVEARLAQLERCDTLIQRQLQLIEQKITGLEQLRSSLQARLDRHAQRRAELLQQRSSLDK
jgi:DNA-binding transcriptional MerR regulator